MHVCHAWPSLTLSIQNASEIQVERELERCKKELKKDLEHARIISEQVRFSIFKVSLLELLSPCMVLQAGPCTPRKDRPWEKEA